MAEELDINDLEIKLADIMHKEWSNKLPKKTKLRRYSLFKNEIKTKEYILSNIDKYKRSLLCQLWIGIRPLEIETGRYTRKKVKDRICKLCKLEIEDEICFVCVCPKLQTVCYKYYNKICSCQNDSILTKFYKIITCKRVKLQIDFLADLWNLRNNILCN